MPKGIDEQVEFQKKKEKLYEDLKKPNIMGYVIVILALIIFFISAWNTRLDTARFGGIQSALNTMRRFFPPDISHFPSLLTPALESFLTACLGTALAIFLSIPLILLAARNISPRFLYPLPYLIGRLIIILSRSVSEVIWAIIFVSAVGLGALPGVLALSARSLGFSAKMMAEKVEDIDVGQIEAIKSTGATTIQVFKYGLVPQVLPIFVSIAILCWDMNLRRATVLGIVGAGGIGLALRNSVIQYQYDQVTTTVIVILMIVVIGEVVSALLRERVT